MSAQPLWREEFSKLIGAGLLGFTLPVGPWFPDSVLSPIGVVSEKVRHRAYGSMYPTFLWSARRGAGGVAGWA